MGKHKVQSAGRELDIIADAYDIREDGRLELFDFNGRGAPIEVAVFDKWDFCFVVRGEADEP